MRGPEHVLKLFTFINLTTMVKYQYQTISVHSSSLDGILNEKGNKGWRLINITPAPNNRFQCIFEKIIY